MTNLCTQPFHDLLVNVTGVLLASFVLLPCAFDAVMKALQCTCHLATEVFMKNILQMLVLFLTATGRSIALVDCFSQTTYTLLLVFKHDSPTYHLPLARLVLSAAASLGTYGKMLLNSLHATCIGTSSNGVRAHDSVVFCHSFAGFLFHIFVSVAWVVLTHVQMLHQIASLQICPAASAVEGADNNVVGWRCGGTILRDSL